MYTVITQQSRNPRLRYTDKVVYPQLMECSPPLTSFRCDEDDLPGTPDRRTEQRGGGDTGSVSLDECTKVYPTQGKGGSPKQV